MLRIVLHDVLMIHNISIFIKICIDIEKLYHEKYSLLVPVRRQSILNIRSKLVMFTIIRSMLRVCSTRPWNSFPPVPKCLDLLSIHLIHLVSLIPNLI